MHLVLNRLNDDGCQIIGSLELRNSQSVCVAKFTTLELSYAGNARQISSIPCGIYRVVPNYSFRFGKGFRLLEVPKRDGILIHSGNFNSDTKGCILIGFGTGMLNDDFEMDILESKRAMRLLLSLLKTATTITISNA